MSASAPRSGPPPAGPANGPEGEERRILERAFARLDTVALGIATGAVLGAGVFLATAVLILRGGENVGYHLQRLAYFLPGYSVTWGGSALGAAEAVVLGFALGAGVAFLWNAYHRAFLRLVLARELRRELQEL